VRADSNSGTRCSVANPLRYVTQVVSSAQFIAEPQLVDVCLSTVCSSLTPARALFWLRVVMQGEISAWADEQLMKAAVEVLVDTAPSINEEEVLNKMRSALLTCDRRELLTLKLNRAVVMPDEDAAVAWKQGAQPMLRSPRTNRRRTIIFLNTRATPIDVLWISFEGCGQVTPSLFRLIGR